MVVDSGVAGCFGWVVFRSAVAEEEVAFWFAKQRLAVAQLLAVRPLRPRHRQGSKSHGNGARFGAKPLPVSGSTLTADAPPLPAFSVVSPVVLSGLKWFFPLFLFPSPMQLLRIDKEGGQGAKAPRPPARVLFGLATHYRPRLQFGLAQLLIVRWTMRALIFIILLAFVTQALASETESYAISSLAHGKELECKITREQLSKTPIWRTQDEFPPLSPRKAEKAATTRFHQLFTDLKHFKCMDIILEKPFFGDGYDGHWIYLVQFVPEEFEIGTNDRIQIMVLMDGTVIDPKPTDAK